MKPGMNIPLRALMVLIVLGLCLCGGCAGSKNIHISGAMSQIRRGDTMLVTLTTEWDGIRILPAHFEVDTLKRNYVLKFRAGNKPVPVTFVRNGQLYARLFVQNVNDISPGGYEEIRRKSFDLTPSGTDELKGKLDL